MIAGFGAARYFWLRRIHSLLGFFPLCAFLLMHFTFNSFIFAGPQAFTDFVNTSQSFPLTIYLEVGLLAAPILFHILLGLVIIYTGAANVHEYGHYRNWMYVMQRVTGILLVPFLAYHVWMTRMQQVFTGHHVDAEYMHSYLLPGMTKFFYVIGILSAAFHMSNGLNTFLITWGITQNERSQYVVSMINWGLFVLLSVWGIAIVYAF